MSKKETQYTQQEIQNTFLPLLKEKGGNYQKSKNIFARSTIKGEKIISITSDGSESINIAKDSDSFVVKNQTSAQEKYIVLGPIFRQKYELLRAAKDGFSEYESKGQIKAIKLTGRLWEQLQFTNNQIYFEAPWGEASILKKHDYMVCPPDYSEVYRIARKEFWETYKKI